MRVCKYLCFSFFLCWSAVGSAFCLQTFNAYGPLYSTELEKRTRLWAAEVALPENKCALLNLQEVWRPQHINLVDQILASSYPNVFDPNLKDLIGVMTMTTEIIKETQVVKFKNNSDGGLLDSVRNLFNVEKAFIATRVFIDEVGEDVWVINTHLHPSSPRVRLAQLLQITKWRLENPHLNLVFSGDFNMKPKGLEHAFFKSVLGVVDVVEKTKGQYPKGFCTYCADNPRSWLNEDHVFDYIFVSNSSTQFVMVVPVSVDVNLRGSGNFTYSDHYGLKADFKMVPAVDESQEGIERRRQYAMAIFSQVIEYLAKGGPEFEDAAIQLAEYRHSILNQTGQYWSIFKDFR